MGVDIPMTGRGDEIEQCVYTVVPKAWVTLDTALFGKNIIVLAFEMPNDLRERSLIVNLVTESWGIDDSEGNAGAFLVELKLYGDRLNPDTFFQVGTGGVVRVFGL